MRPALPSLLAVLMLATARSPAARAAPLQGAWSGTLHTMQGRCPTDRPSSLVVHGGRVSFAPADGVLVLLGHVKPDGEHLHAQLQLPGVDRKPVPMVFEGHRQDEAVVGVYGTPTCRAEVLLLRAHDRPLQRALGR